MLAIFRDFPDGKVVYIAPLKALVSERIQDWKIRIESKLKKKVVELTGDVAPDIGAIQVKLQFKFTANPFFSLFTFVKKNRVLLAINTDKLSTFWKFTHLNIQLN